MMISRRKNQELENFEKTHKDLCDRFYEIALRVQSWEEVSAEDMTFAESVVQKMLDAGVPASRIQVLKGIGRSPAEWKQFLGG